MHAIIRIKKHKSGSVAAVDAHNRRLIDVPNAAGDFVRRSQNGSRTLNDVIKSRLDSLGIKKHRKDAVVAVEVMMSASPEFFRPDKPKSHGHHDPRRTLVWARHSINYLKKKYKDNLVDYVIHLDEATPHIHAIVVPAVKKMKRKRRTNAEIDAGTSAQQYEANTLDAKNMFDMRALYELQEEYPQHMSIFGLKRGRKNSKASHAHISEYYSNVNESSRREMRVEREHSYGLSM